jgi:hypothetical protein
MNPKVTIVVLAKYVDVFEKFFHSVEKFFPDVPKILVADGKEIIEYTATTNVKNWRLIPGPAKFTMAGNGNLGLKAVPLDSDILYVGDDIRFLDADLIKNLQEAAYKKDDIGIVSPRLIGRGSPPQVNPPFLLTQVTPLQMWFPCVYIKRTLLDKIGFLDEQFNDFGCDDFDFCIRTQLAGFKLAVTNSCAVVHEASIEGGPTTFCKTISADQWRKQEVAAQAKVKAKYNLNDADFAQLLKTGDTNIIKQKSHSINIDDVTNNLVEEGMLCSRAEAIEFLKKQHIMIATPCYGGQMACNYANSLLALINQCHNIGVTYTTSFIYNESLITRARNRLANDFMKSKATHLLFVDADISFDPRDILSFLMYDKDIIGIPCARKNLRLDRVAAAVKKNGREYSIEELEALTGEFVINFPPDQVTNSINISKMTEVMEVGTGLMMIRRATMDKFVEAYPERKYLQMFGEEQGVRTPCFMFFQAGFDEESRKYNPDNLPDYISEDYWFCRDARRAGMKVWLAPWAVSTHAGTYMFKGDMKSVALAGGSLR